jgi:pyruvate formate lyase activating enzyme
MTSMFRSPPRARFYERFPDDAVSCRLCPHGCFLRNGGIGVCGARKNRNGTLQALTYGEVTGAAVDPVEKKPLYHFHPGARIYSVGAWGCNMKCVFCQNSAISQEESPTVPLTPAEVARNGMADGSIGVAHTYNEPLVAMEYVIDCCREVRRLKGKNVIVTNGFVNRAPLEELLPWVDAFNIDVKAFNNDFYKRMCGAKLEPVLDTVQFLAGKVHMELTTLLIPEANDAIPELEDLAEWISDACGRFVPCHLTAYHPSYRYNGAATTDAVLKNARYIFRKKLQYVYLGNVTIPGASDTQCMNCGRTVVKRAVFDADASGMNPDGSCAHCGAANNFVV